MDKNYRTRRGTGITEYALPTVLILTVGLGGLQALIGSMNEQNEQKGLLKPEVKHAIPSAEIATPPESITSAPATSGLLGGKDVIPHQPGTGPSEGKTGTRPIPRHATRWRPGLPPGRTELDRSSDSSGHRPNKRQT